MSAQMEADFPPGHPARFDYNPDSPEAIEWMRRNLHPKGERDFPVDHPKAIDTPGNMNHITNVAGVDPAHPELQPFTGRTPAQVEALERFNREAAAIAVESEPREPIIAPNPPASEVVAKPTGQPGIFGVSLWR